MTVALRPFAEDDAAWLDTWLAPVAALVGSTMPDSASLVARLGADASTCARVIEHEGARVGLLVYSVDTPVAGAAIIELLATPPPEARRGSGMMAAAAAEGELRARRVRVVYAPAPAVHGIAMYFWIRLGYRPLLRARWPCDSPGVAWLARDLG